MRAAPHSRRCFATLLVAVGSLVALALSPAGVRAQNAIVVENQLAGNPPSEWDVNGSGDASIQGFATDISVNRGGGIGFKVSTDAAQYEIRVYRLGWYQGNGARLVATLGPFVGAVQTVPSPDAVTGLVDCGAWDTATTWSVPGTAVSGLYLARLVRLDTQGASHVVFVVRDDAGTSDLYFKTSDATWQAYNVYGGNSLYVGTAPFPSGHAAKVSYNRPFLTRAGGGGGGASEDWLFNAEYPMVRWLEANGYDVSYTTDVDADRNGALIANHAVFLSVGHDEYWSAAERANVEAARDAGTHLAFLSGNEVYWKTRWETSTDGSGTPYRTLVCYKEGTLGENACGSKCDPLPGTWTGLWRDGCAFSPPADGCRPENALTGQISWGSGEGALLVPDTFKDHRLWRNTSVASLGSGQVATLGSRILGYEFDYEQYAASAPAGRVPLSSTDLGGHTHRLSLHRAPGGALVFGAGTVQWSWGLDAQHDRGSDAAVPAIQQATVNLLAEMGAQPGSLQGGLVAATATGDAAPPVSAIAAPAAGDTLALGTPVTVSGTASEVGGGTVAAVEVSVDGGATWTRATGTTAWSLTWTPSATGPDTLLARAVDDLGNLETPGAGTVVLVADAGASQCPCTVFLPGEAPANPDNNDGQPIELGMKFRATEAGLVTGVRYFKGAGWTSGTRTGHLWSYPAGTPLAEVVFAGESASGWQQASFSSPVAITAGTTYVVSVFSSAGNYGFDGAYFTNAVVRPPLRALANGEDGPNGVYHYGSAGYPASTYNASNYWVDVVFETGPDTTPPTVGATSPAPGATGVSPYATVSATFSEAMDAATVSTSTFELRDAGNAPVPASVAYDAPSRTATLTPGTLLANDATYTARLAGAPATPRLQDLAGNALAADVTWSFTIAPPDLAPPTVSATVPAANASGISVNAAVQATFGEALDPASVSTATFELRDPADALVAATVTYNVYSHVAGLVPASPLAAGTVYTAKLRGGASGPRVRDLAGNALAADFTWSFTTGAAAATPPGEGPGGPILVVSSAGDPFSRYYAEILRCEGLNAFHVRDLPLVTAATLDSAEVVILAATGLTAPQAALFSDWVDAGGDLVAVRPDASLAPLLGLGSISGTLANAYLRVDTTQAPGRGIAGMTMQFHHQADLWSTSGATTVATLYSDTATATAHPAVTVRSVGTQGGHAAAFTYDLARSIVYTRQGNPAWVGQERDGVAPIRSDDLFYGAAAGDPQPDWVDLSRVAIPQADEQQRLLVNLLHGVLAGEAPLPRFWYFPSGRKAVVIHTGDNHGSAGTPVRFDANVAASPPGCSLPDWECVRSTSYLYAGAPLADAQVQQYQDAGFEIGVHLNTGCADWTPASLEAAWASQRAGAEALYPSLRPQVTHRTHCIAWSDWSSEASIQAARGVRLDCNYYYWPPTWVQNRPGVFTGSAMPMRFAALDGSLIDCYQAATQMTDESGQGYPFTCNTLLDRALGPEGYYGAYCTNIHLDGSSETISSQVVASAQARGVPVVSAAQMLEWLDGRSASRFDAIAWNGSTLTFSLVTGSGARNLRALLPVQQGAAGLVALTRNAAPVAYATETIKGIAYAMFAADSGQYAATYGIDASPPAISGLTATPGTDGTALIQWTTDEPADSRVDYGTDAGTLTQSASNAALVTSHALSLSGLAPATTYHFRVTSADAAANASTSPAPPSAPATFATPAGPCALDDLAADFAAGAPTGAAVSGIAGGEVTLAPAAATEFGGTTLPAGWTSANGAPWNGGTPVVGGGLLAVNGCIAGTQATFSPGSSLEFVATFPAEAFVHVGWVGDLGFNDPWVIVSTGSAGTGVYARSNTNPSGVLLAGASFGAPHRYRIDWTATSFVFWVDGVQQATIAQTAAGPLVVAASDLALNATSLTLDWLRVLPYATPGQFASRVFDAGQAVQWGAATWNAALPAGTSLAVSARTGDVPAPDGSWSAYAPLASSGSSVNAHARYLQYRADLATTDPAATPELRRIEFACATGADTTAPAISAVSVATSSDGTGATVTWTTDEPATSVVDYGTSPGSLGSQASSGALVTSHAVALTGLTPGTPYWFRVTSADAAANAATEPGPPSTPLTFTTPEPPCRADSLAADFAAGTRAGTHVAATGDGEVILAPAEGCEFTGAALPAGWGSASYGGGGTVTLTGTAVDLDGAFVRTDAFHAAGRTVEFVATFDAVAAGQHGGFGNTLNESEWAIFSTGPSGGTLLARTMQGGNALEQNLGASWLGAPHRFRVDWKADSAVFWVDGQRLAGLANAVAGPLRPIVSDGPVGGTPLRVDWVRMSPYAANGTFDSRVLDAGGPATWGAATWDAATPAGTSLAIAVRTGGTPVPDGTWTAFATLPASGSAVGATARYLQYRASLASGDALASPELRAFGVACQAAPDLTPPVVTNVVATPSLASALVTWTTDEPADSRVDYGTSAGSLGSSQASSALVTSHAVTLPGLAAGTTYHFRVTSADASANAATEPAPPATLTFATPAPACLTDALAADFAAGTPAGTAVAETADGEVLLAPAHGGEFSGTALDPAWTSVPWTGGSTTLAGGAASVDGARLSPLATSGPGLGTALEFRATFGAAAYQNAGLGAGDNGTGAGGMYATGDRPWAMFGTAGTTSTLFTRLNPGGDVSLGGAYLGAPHTFRVEWFTGAGGDSVAFYVDGASVDRRASTIAGGTTLRPGFSDYASGAPALLVDWARQSPYPASGTFTSRVYDSGSLATWDRLTWNAVLPPGTAIALSARTGDTPAPDGTWTAFQPVAASGDVVGGTSRYAQYRAVLSSADAGVTPALLEVTLACNPCTEHTPPPAIAGLAATRAGNAGNGRAQVRLDWSGVTPGHAVAVYRRGRGDHPLYRAGHGGVPAVPATPAAALADGWALTAVTAPAGLDAPASRDHWYYVAFVRNSCGLDSPPSNLAGGALDYVLGDVSDGSATCLTGGEPGDGLVSTPDLSTLGASYGTAFDTTDARTCLDVGPTVDHGPRSLPVPDGTLDFEDLVIYALNWEVPLAGPARAQPARAAKPAAGADAAEALALSAPAEVRAGQTFEVALRYRGAGRTRAVSTRLSWDPAAARWEGHDAGALLAGAGGLALSPRPGTVDVAVLGADGSLAGEGDLAVVRLRALRDGAPGVALVSADARDGENRPVPLGRWDAAAVPPAPRSTMLGAVFPNPFRGELNVSYALSRPARVRVTVLDLAGRLVRRLADGPCPAGLQVSTWDGRTDGGVAAAPGTYLILFEAGEVHQTRRVQLVR